MNRNVTAIVLGLVIALSTAPFARADNAIYGWWGSAEVRVPGQGVKVVVVKGVITAPNGATALAIGKEHGNNQASQYGEIVRQPVIELISPFYVPSIQSGIRNDLRPSGG
jgi:hypothetical protein